jgi:hypothetical protein
MKKIIFIFSSLIIFSACGNNIGLTQIKSNENIFSNATPAETPNKEQADFSFEKLVSSQNPSKKLPKWIAPGYNGLQLSKAVQDDISKMFGKPKEEFHPFSEYESTDDEWTFYYENINDFDGSISFTFDIRSKILKEVWLRPDDERPLTIEKAIETYGNDYFVRGYGKYICSSKQLTKLEYPFTIVYPHKGIFLWVREGNTVDDIFYTAKCPA